MSSGEPFKALEMLSAPGEPSMILIFEDGNANKYGTAIAGMAIEAGFIPGLVSDARIAETRLHASLHAYNDIRGVITGFGAKDTTTNEPQFSAESFIRTAVGMGLRIALLTKAGDPDPADYANFAAGDIAVPLTPLLGMAIAQYTRHEATIRSPLPPFGVPVARIIGHDSITDSESYTDIDSDVIRLTGEDLASTSALYSWLFTIANQSTQS